MSPPGVKKIARGLGTVRPHKTFAWGNIFEKSKNHKIKNRKWVQVVDKKWII